MDEYTSETSITQSDISLSTGENTLRASMDNKHWVEELFPPAFGLTVDEILEDIGKPKEEEEMGFFEKFARGIHPQDLSAIKNVYERVWLMATIEKEEKEKKTLEKEKVGTLNASKLLEKGSRSVEVCDAQTSTEDLEKYNIHDPCIWTNSEIDVLREVFQTARKQNRELQVQLAETSQRLAFLEQEYKKQRTELESKGKNLSEAVNANTRLSILCNNLNKQLKSVTSKNKAMVEEIGILETDRTNCLQEAHEAKMELDKERLERRAVETNLEKRSNEAVREQAINEERVRTQCERKMNAMERRMEELSQELQEERKSHVRTKRGLDHLRTHFSSLPYSGETTGMVEEDQLQKWTF